LDKGKGGSETWRFSASHTLEYSFSSYAVAQWAKLLGKESDYQQLMGLSKGWQQLFNPELKLIQPKWENGKFIDNFNPSQAWRGFQEGNAYQYTFYVPHDAKGLIAKVGRDTFNLRLDSIFRNAQKNAFGGGKVIDAFAGVGSLYNHGNQPSLHTSWLFNFSQKPSLTQKWVRAICNEFYGVEGIHGYGYGQDEDQGQLGAWYVLSSMGLFDVAGLTDSKPQLGIGSPLFTKIKIKGNKKYYNGNDFEIDVKNNSAENIYVQSFTLNGKTLHQPFIQLTDVQRGGKLAIKMGDHPKDQY
jgi:predicted alpha-1,2-mannosidase